MKRYRFCKIYSAKLSVSPPKVSIKRDIYYIYYFRGIAVYPSLTTNKVKLLRSLICYHFSACSVFIQFDIIPDLFSRHCHRYIVQQYENEGTENQAEPTFLAEHDALLWVYLGVKTCEVFLCFVTIMFVLYLLF